MLPPSLYPISGQEELNANAQISDHVTPKYYDPKSGQVYDAPPSTNTWCIVDGTPATCAQLALFHHDILFPRSPSLAERPIDLVISGPNHGRNTTAAFALSSGTLGGALEAAVCGVRAVAISFAFFTRQESPELIREASSLSIKVTDRLCESWPDWKHTGVGAAPQAAATSHGPDLFSINVPLKEGVSNRPIKWTWMLDNKLNNGSMYKEIASSAETTASMGASSIERPRSFRWAPSFADVWNTVEDSPPGNDGLVIREGCTSVTPLRTNFESLWGKEHFVGDMKL